MKKNHQKLWSTMNKFSAKETDKSNVISSLKVDDIKYYDGRQVSYSFAKYFSTMGQKFAKHLKKLIETIK